MASFFDNFTRLWVWEAIIAAGSVGVVCSLLSVVVVLKRMAFIGQGISHAGFGGYGLALLLGLTGLVQQGVMGLFCLVTAIVLGRMMRSRRIEPDTAIGIVLVGGMAFGVLSVNTWQALQSVPWYQQAFGTSAYTVQWESLLFGSAWMAGPQGMWTALILAVVVLTTGALLFKELLCFTFDETSSRVYGVPTAKLYYLIVLLLALVVVVGMRLVGVVLVSALLVLPGATALQLSRRLGTVLWASALIGLIASVGGLMLNLMVQQLSPGPCIVGLLCLMFIGVSLIQRLPRPAPAPA